MAAVIDVFIAYCMARTSISDCVIGGFNLLIFPVFVPIKTDDYLPFTKSDHRSGSKTMT